MDRGGQQLREVYEQVASPGPRATIRDGYSGITTSGGESARGAVAPCLNEVLSRASLAAKEGSHAARSSGMWVKRAHEVQGQSIP